MQSEALPEGPGKLKACCKIVNYLRLPFPSTSPTIRPHLLLRLGALSRLVGPEGEHDAVYSVHCHSYGSRGKIYVPISRIVSRKQGNGRRES